MNLSLTKLLPCVICSLRKKRSVLCDYHQSSSLPQPWKNAWAKLSTLFLSYWFPHIGYLINSKENVDHLSSAMKELKPLSEDVKTMVDDAKARQRQCKKQVERWLERVQEIESEVIAIEQRFQQRKRCPGECHPNCWLNYKLGKKAAIKLTLVHSIKEEGSFDSVVIDESHPLPVVEMPNTSGVGIDSTFKKFQGLVREDGVGIICTHGMGGVGKTTLLKKINNELHQDDPDFDVVIWVTVSKGPQEVIVRKVQDAIGQRLRLSLRESSDERAQTIFSLLKNKKFMLLLDDLWERLHFEKVGIPCSNSQYKSKIAFTTRSADVCGHMGSHRRIKLEVLKEKEAWELFQTSVGTHVDLNSPSIRSHAKTVAQKCGGLPLALVAVGRAMANKGTINEWKDVVRALKKSAHEIQSLEADLFQLLRISYDNLPDDTIKSCFLYSSLFPEGHSIFTEQLVDYYIGEGFFDNISDAEDARNKGHSIIASLKAACLLENDDDDEERQVKLHDIMRHLAFWIASESGKNNKFLVHEGAEAPEVEDRNEIEMIAEFEKWKEAERISLMNTGLKALTGKPNCPNLLTLILHNNWGLIRVSSSFFEFMPALKVLDLSMTDIKELPEGIGKLLELKYLNLMLTKIKSLPIELKSLEKLKYLNLSYANLVSNPCEVILSFPKLQVLKLDHCSSENWKISLEELRRLNFLSTLGININSAAGIDQIFKSKKLLKCLRYLYISDCEDLLSIWLPSVLRDGRSLHLRALRIRTCKRLEYITVGAETEEEKSNLSSLEELTLEALPNVKIIWKEVVNEGCFHNLRSVHIGGCHKLRNITWVVHLENLRVLYLSSCHGIEEIILSGDATQEEELLAFSKLREMELRGLPKLKSIYSHAIPFPCLKDLYILDCPKLKKLPLTTVGIKKTLQGIRGTQEWWNGLEWEDGDTKAAFTPYFREWA